MQSEFLIRPNLYKHSKKWVSLLRTEKKTLETSIKRAFSGKGELSMSIKITALYERLSRDDEMQGESSIKNQKEYLEDFARKNGFRNIRYFTEM